MHTYYHWDEVTGLAQIRPIGFIRTPFRDRFGVPRQPGLVPAAWGEVELAGDPDLVRAIFTLEKFTHIWLIFLFDRAESKNWKPSIRPPRLGGAERVGVLSSRSPHRPNPIGMSAVKLDGIRIEGPKAILSVSGTDLLDKTPILDVKPYLPYCDSIDSASSGWASEPIPRYAVQFTAECSVALRNANPRWRKLVEQLLAIDPRPAHQKGQVGERYGMSVEDYDVRYRVIEQSSGALIFEVFEIVPLLDRTK